MSANLDLQLLREQSQLFALLDERGLQLLLEAARQVQFSHGHELMREGEHSDSFYVVVEGKLRVFIDDRGVREEVALLGRGAFVGEIAALIGEARNATVVCEGEAWLLCFDASRVNALLGAYPHVRQALVKLALKRSEDNLQRMLQVSLIDEPALDDEG
jgi:CRP-like cAMP-binding protein